MRHHDRGAHDAPVAPEGEASLRAERDDEELLLAASDSFELVDEGAVARAPPDGWRSMYWMEVAPSSRATQASSPRLSYSGMRRATLRV